MYTDTGPVLERDLAQQAGLAEDPLYASLSEDISHVQSLGLAVRGSDEQLRSELFLAIDH